MSDEEEMTAALYVLLVSLHPIYGSTAGRSGGIGGQAITPHCSVNYPDEREQAARDWAEGVLRSAIDRLVTNGFDLMGEVQKVMSGEVATK